jgi:hypothetical protein
MPPALIKSEERFFHPIREFEKPEVLFKFNRSRLPVPAITSFSPPAKYRLRLWQSAIVIAAISHSSTPDNPSHGPQCQGRFRFTPHRGPLTGACLPGIRHTIEGESGRQRCALGRVLSSNVGSYLQCYLLEFSGIAKDSKK